MELDTPSAKPGKTVLQCWQITCYASLVESWSFFTLVSALFLAIQQFAALTYDELVESREAGWQI